MKKKICFVIMGFGKKKDPVTNRTVDLDETYKKIIRPAVVACNYKCVRADEISESGVIDRSMFALLINAELVIADITTYNPNALYELGVRHAVRPYSTIIIKEEEEVSPFDINHSRTLSYKHLGSEITDVEAKRSVRALRELINTVTQSPVTDSPLYSFIPKVVQPTLAQEDFDQIIGELRTKEDSIYSLMENARELMSKNDFVNAALKWQRLSEMVEKDSFFVQQHALCEYKSATPNKLVALTNALTIIDRLRPFHDAESLGIAGAINKNLWRVTQDVEFLNIAIEHYKKGWSLFSDYYTGENYANCLEQRALKEEDSDTRTYFKVEAKRTRKEVIDIVQPLMLVSSEELEEVKWRSATLSNCYRALGDVAKSKEYEQKFLNESPVPWEIKTFETTKNELIELNKK